MSMFCFFKKSLAAICASFPKVPLAASNNAAIPSSSPIACDFDN